NGKIAGKTNAADHFAMFTLLPQNGGYVGSASLICGDSAVLLGGANDTSVVLGDTGQASRVTKLSDEDLADSYKGLFVGAWQNVALDTMSPSKQAKATDGKPKSRSIGNQESKKTG
ncbi:MAG: hypothetical protein HQ501_06710, partial [Rhodospirillales bacterium]|nr:hypothetical protein [Rhodospirillales bacterium]